MCSYMGKPFSNLNFLKITEIFFQFKAIRFGDHPL